MPPGERGRTGQGGGGRVIRYYDMAKDTRMADGLKAEFLVLVGRAHAVSSGVATRLTPWMMVAVMNC